MFCMCRFDATGNRVHVCGPCQRREWPVVDASIRSGDHFEI
jgi:hypothetical protein